MNKPDRHTLEAIVRLSGSHDWNTVVDWIADSLRGRTEAMYRGDEQMMHLAGGCQVLNEQIQAFNEAPELLEALRREEKRNG